MPRPAQPVGFKRKCGNGYMLVRHPDHQRANPKNGGYVYEHVFIAETALGKPLLEIHPVHHHNTVRTDNRNQNLVICEDKNYHLLLHTRMRVLAAGGDPDVDKLCDYCGLCKKSDFGKRSGAPDGLCRECRSCKSKIDRLNYAVKTGRACRYERPADL